VVLTSWAGTAIVCFRFHCLALFLLIGLRTLSAIIIALSDQIAKIKLSRNSAKRWQKVRATMQCEPYGSSIIVGLGRMARL
jgi:hypothetical protein